MTDGGGMAIAGAVIHGISSRGGESYDAISTRSGDYNLAALPPDEYKVEISASGYENQEVSINLAAGSRVRREFRLAKAVRPVPGTGIDSETQTQAQTFAPATVRGLPTLTRDPFRLAALAGNTSDAGLGTRGVGTAINGQRESSTNILLDGVDNKDEFAGSVGHPYPLDSIQEFTVITSGFTAEFGRASGGIVNAVGRRGGPALHGGAYDFNRISALTSNSYQSNANGQTEPGFIRNQFGEELGGPVRGHRFFFFENFEGTLIRSKSTQYAWIATPQLLAQSAPNTQSFFQSLGQLRTDAQILGTASLNQLAAIFGRSPCLGLVCATLPANIPLFSHVAYETPGDAGGGFPQNTWNTYVRGDYDLSDKTRLYGRYGLYDEHDQPGVLSNSPYANYDLTQKQFDNSALISAIRRWNERWVSQTSLAFDRIRMDQQGLTSRGVAPSLYANPLAPLTIGADALVFPGYNPYTPGVGGAFGGPENILQISHDASWSRGNHFLRFGGSYIYTRDNRTDAAYQTAVDSLANSSVLGAALIGLLQGTLAQIQVAVNPQGQFACSVNTTCNLKLPVSSPDFSRSNRFHDAALYAQDYWRFRRRIAINLGVRWDHFGVQHDSNPALDSNWYTRNAGFADSNLISYLVLGGLQLAAKSPIGGLYKPDWKDFAPRIGFAWDLFGDGRTSVRAGYGIAYDRNFGNVTFNVIQNTPNYAILNVPGPITTSNFGPLGASTGTTSLPPPSARIIDPELRTAYAEVWNASVQRQVTRTLNYSFEYSGSKGVDLYSISYPNQAGFRNAYYPDSPCLGLGDCRTEPNPFYSEDVGYRGNQGFSTYYGINNRFVAHDLLHTGATLSATYTWSHAIDNISSTFFEAGGLGVANRYGDRNITINNGYFDTGLLDPFHPNLDKGDAEFDVRHRVTVWGDWAVPGWNHAHWSRMLLGGWSIDPLFTARSGQPFSVFDTVAQTLDLSAPRATFTGSYPKSRNTFVASTTPDTYHIITFQTSQFAHEPNLLTPGSQWPANLSKRDAFRAPGFWNFDLALFKDTRITERLTLQLRGEMFNVFNHANLYVIGSTANVGAENTIDACFGCTGSSFDRRQVQLAARFSF